MKFARLRLLAIVAVFISFATAADAHRLKLFATVEDGTVHGYGFFIGGGRPSEAQLVIRNGQGIELFRGPAGADGSFKFKPATPTDLVLTIDAGDGHVAETRIVASRFPDYGALGAVGAAKAADEMTEEPPAAGSPQPVLDSAQSTRELAVMIDRSVDRAVSRQLAPLLEAYAEADGRARFSDVVSGIAVIIGLAGLMLWARSRSRTRTAPPGRRHEP